MVRTLALYQNGEFALISNKCPLISVPEKKLSIALKVLLVLEAIAKVTFMVSGALAEKSTPLRLHRLIYEFIYCYLQSFWDDSLQITHSVQTPMAHLPPYISPIGMAFLLTVSKHECLTFLQVYPTRIWRPASNTGSVQGSRVVEG